MMSSTWLSIDVLGVVPMFDKVTRKWGFFVLLTKRGIGRQAIIEGL